MNSIGSDNTRSSLTDFTSIGELKRQDENRQWFMESHDFKILTDKQWLEIMLERQKDQKLAQTPEKGSDRAKVVKTGDQ